MKVSIIGAGNVGATVAYTLLVKGGCDAISIIDTNQEKALGEAEDLSHGVSLSKSVEIRAQGYEGVRDADVIVVTAGRNRRPGGWPAGPAVYGGGPGDGFPGLPAFVPLRDPLRPERGRCGRRDRHP
jgi:threonine dehydrogenase-like Zn-dependent dehydrogenase